MRESLPTRVWSSSTAIRLAALLSTSSRSSQRRLKSRSRNLGSSNGTLEPMLHDERDRLSGQASCAGGRRQRRKYRKMKREGQGSLQDIKTPAVFGGW